MTSSVTSLRWRIKWRVAARESEAMNADDAGGAWGRVEASLVLKFLGFVDLRP